eukprot:m.241865 g.241865  ORF g.241865 m.241865 type:complete len:199 (-) comp24865_c0_seq1:23-619(-)
MVHSVLMLNATAGQPVGIVYSTFFGNDFGLGETGDDFALQTARTAQKQAALQIAGRVYSEASFRRALLGPSALTQPGPGQTILDLPYYHDGGAFRLKEGEPFATRKLVLWVRLGNFASVFVLDPEDNVALAESVISYFSKYICTQHVRAIEQPADVLATPEIATAFLRAHVPNGVLLFANSVMEKQLDAECEALFATT